jgi:hypothetical protein
MQIMLSNNTGKKVRALWAKYPTRFACLFGIDGWRNVDMPYALDNGRYAATTKGKDWEVDKFRLLLDKAAAHKKPPIFVVVPDVVADREATLAEWDTWTDGAHWFKRYKFKLAFVVQDGMAPEDVPPSAEWVFIGGSPKWKRANIWRFCNKFENVHVGGVNSPRTLWVCHKSGAKSIDGTGWFRGDERQWRGLLQYLYRSENALGEKQGRLFDLYEADAMGARFYQKFIEELKEDCIEGYSGEGITLR